MKVDLPDPLIQIIVELDGTSELYEPRYRGVIRVCDHLVWEGPLVQGLRADERARELSEAKLVEVFSKLFNEGA